MAPTSENFKRYQVEYVKQNVRQFMLKMNRIHEPELIDWLESKDNIQAYLKELIRADMEKNQTN